MFLATTALTQFWDETDEIVPLGPWCLRYAEDHARWEKLRSRVLPSPWEDPEQARIGLRRCEETQDALLPILARYLNGVHGVAHSERYWRALLGPWLMHFVSGFCDRELTLRKALESYPDARTLRLDPADYRIPATTAQHSHWLSTDAYSLQIYSEILQYWGHSAPARRLFPRPTEEQPPVRPAWKALAWRVLSAVGAAARRVRPASVYFADLYCDREHLWRLVRTSGFRVQPILGELAESFAFKAVRDAHRQGLAKLQGKDDFQKLLISALAAHLPTLYLEGYAALRTYVLSGWEKLPQLLLTCVGWNANEYFKMLAAESLERDGRLVILQHGGAYGVFKVMDTERLERNLADHFWTWGWTDPSPYVGRARLAPMPNPRLSAEAPRPKSGSLPKEWLLVSSTLPQYPYTWYMANVPVWHRFESYLDHRERFLAALPEKLRQSLKVRLHSRDLGWGHKARLGDRFPNLNFDLNPAPWRKRTGQFRLVAVDQPQSSYVEAVAANIPTLMTWNPADWRLREAAIPYFDLLREAGILYDDPAQAARKAAEIFEDPWAWWLAEKLQKARAKFCDHFGRGSRDWAQTWSRELELLGKS